jgi:phage terminase large subunit
MNLNVPDKLIPLFNPNDEYGDYGTYIIKGGRCSGKSWGVRDWLLTEIMKEQLTVQLSRYCSTTIDLSSKKLFTDGLETHKLTNHFKITDEKAVSQINGSTVYFKGLKGGSLIETRNKMRSSEGIDILIVDEAQTLNEGMLEDIDPTIRGFRKASGKKRKRVYILNPYEVEDPVIYFYKHSNDCCEISINIEDNPFAPADMIAKSNDMKLNDYELWLHIYGGYHKSLTARAFITPADYEEMINRKQDRSALNSRIQIGADIARFGDDLTVFTKRVGYRLTEIREYRKQDLATTTEELIKFAGGNPIVCDDTGLVGVTDFIRKRGYPIYGLNFAQKPGINPITHQHYPNITTELWFNFRSMKDKISMINHPKLKYELLNRKRDYDHFSREIIESKADYKKIHKKSPDFSDATMMAYFKPPTSNKNIRIYR